jgi:crossover junction endodeoxyribonuclease RuvC
VRILGIDPGSRATGYGVIEVEGSSLARVAGGVIRPAAEPLPERLGQIALALENVIAETRPDGAAVESVFAARNARSALLLGQARGAALVACGRSGLETAEYAPTRVKQAVVGYGSAPKPQVQRMVQRLLALAVLPASDEADALAIAICHAHTGRSAAAALGPARRPPRSARWRGVRAR